MFVVSERGAALVLFLYCTCSNASADPSAPEPLTRDRVIELARMRATRRAVNNARAPGIARGIKAAAERFCSRLSFQGDDEQETRMLEFHRRLAAQEPSPLNTGSEPGSAPARNGRDRRPRVDDVSHAVHYAFLAHRNRTAMRRNLIAEAP